MMMPSLATKIEAILYLKGKPVSIAEIAEYAGCDRDDAEDSIIQLMTDYAHRDSALEVVETPEGYTLQLRSPFQSLVETLVPLDLGIGALRTLAAIALKGSITQSELVDLRGSGAYQHVQELVEFGFVTKRRQDDGRSYWLQVTEKFHQYFEVEQLPQLSQLDVPTAVKNDEFR
ncbi:SMC-Scp complex subunit ScpB [Trichocoleus sp. FACHB-69]|jgi:segregation and condensation protein B